MNLLLSHSTIHKQSTIAVTGSKSETNRLLLLQALYPNLQLSNSSNSDDSQTMQKALSSTFTTKDIHHAGTAMRFLTAYYAIQPDQETILTGSARMQERPIQILVDALQQLGVSITYQAVQGYPPICIKGQKITKNKVSLNANVSSQYISALLLIAPKLENGLILTLQGEITSVPYLKMTLAILNDLGITTTFTNNTITVQPRAQIANTTFVIESDWSSASYFYSIVALSPVGTQITLGSYKPNSLQGDSALVSIYQQLGVTTQFNNHTIQLTKTQKPDNQHLIIDLNNCPDIAQTIVVTCFALGKTCHLTGLHTLKIKETDRLEALKTELTKLGATVSVTNHSITLGATEAINSTVAINTYQDHRMAMAFAPLALKVPIVINDAEVVSKSFPDFWEDLKKIGVNIQNTIKI